jgi:hypothetical protein
MQFIILIVGNRTAKGAVFMDANRYQAIHFWDARGAKRSIRAKERIV